MMRVNVMMGIFWLSLGGTLLGAHLLGKEIPGVRPDRGAFIGVFAMVLAAYNFGRWWASRVREKSRAAAAGEPPKKRPVERSAEYHPEFDFNRNDSSPSNGQA